MSLHHFFHHETISLQWSLVIFTEYDSVIDSIVSTYVYVKLMYKQPKVCVSPRSFHANNAS